MKSKATEAVVRMHPALLSAALVLASCAGSGDKLVAEFTGFRVHVVGTALTEEAAGRDGNVQKPDEGFKFLIAYLAIENTGEAVANVHIQKWKLKIEGKIDQREVSYPSIQNLSWPSVASSIPPGYRARFRSVFQVPEISEAWRLKVEPPFDWGAWHNVTQRTGKGGEGFSGYLDIPPDYSNTRLNFPSDEENFRETGDGFQYGGPAAISALKLEGTMLRIEVDVENRAGNTLQKKEIASHNPCRLITTAPIAGCVFFFEGEEPAIVKKMELENEPKIPPGSRGQLLLAVDVTDIRSLTTSIMVFPAEGEWLAFRLTPDSVGQG